MKMFFVKILGTQEISRHTQILWKSMQYIAKVEKTVSPSDNSSKIACNYILLFRVKNSCAFKWLMVGWGFWFVMFTCMEIVPAKYNRWKTGANSQTIRKHQDSPDSVWCNAQGPRDHRKLGACQMRRNKQRGKQADSTSGKWHAKGGRNTKDENLGRSKSTSAEQNKQLSNTQAVRRLKQEKLPEATLGVERERTGKRMEVSQLIMLPPWTRRGKEGGAPWCTQL